MRLPILIVAAVLFCMAYTESPDSIIGKWKMTSTEINGVQDTANPNVKVMYYEFADHNSFMLSWVRTTDTTTYRIDGTYIYAPGEKQLTITFRDKANTTTVYSVVEHSPSVLVLETLHPNSHAPVYVNRFERQ